MLYDVFQLKPRDFLDNLKTLLSIKGWKSEFSGGSI
jgi:hypothetical protein